MFTSSSVKSQNFIRSPKAIVQPRQIFKRKGLEIVISSKINDTTKVAFASIFKLLNYYGLDVLKSIFESLKLNYTEFKNDIGEELKDLDTKKTVGFVLGNLVFRVPIGIGQAIVWIIKWLGNSLEEGRFVKYIESTNLKYNAKILRKIPRQSSPVYIIKDKGDLENIGSYMFDYEIEFTDADNNLRTLIVKRNQLDVNTYDFMQFAWEKFKNAGMTASALVESSLNTMGLKSDESGTDLKKDFEKSEFTKGVMKMLKAVGDIADKGITETVKEIGSDIKTKIKENICGPTTTNVYEWNACLQKVVDDKGTVELRKLLLQALQRLDMNTTDEYKEFKEKLIKMLDSNYSLYEVFQNEVLKLLNRKYIPQIQLAEADFVEIINDEEHKKDLEEMRIVYDIYSDIPTKTME
jgi:hypothetical protein